VRPDERNTATAPFAGVRWQRYAAGAFILVATLAAGLGGFIVGDRSGADLDRARDEGMVEGAAQVQRTRVPADQVRDAERAGRRSGFRRAYREAFRREKAKVLAAAPQNCGDARTNETPIISKVRAERIGCATALGFARRALTCQDLDGGACQGYTCSTVSIGWEASEVTCVSGARRIRFITAV
jgi:hypothetical protein